MNPPKIIELTNKVIVGICRSMSLSTDSTAEMWKSFMPRRNEIHNQKNNGFFSIREYESLEQFYQFSPQTEFKKWAAVEVGTTTDIPEGMTTKTFEGGLYARFIHVGPVSTFSQTMNFIFGEWLPKSKYQLDHRAHFEIMGDKYLGVDNPKSEEEVYVPIVLKNS